MTNFGVCKAFVNGNNGGVYSLNMSISHDGKRLYSYSTCIAERVSDDEIIVNTTKYSSSTSRHQYYLRDAMRGVIKETFTKVTVPRNAQHLCQYVK